jgi:hypothetical protein
MVSQVASVMQVKLDVIAKPTSLAPSGMSRTKERSAPTWRR